VLLLKAESVGVSAKKLFDGLEAPRAIWSDETYIKVVDWTRCAFNVLSVL
jgi:hypothetical protein